MSFSRQFGRFWPILFIECVCNMPLCVLPTSTFNKSNKTTKTSKKGGEKSSEYAAFEPIWTLYVYVKQKEIKKEE